MEMFLKGNRKGIIYLDTGFNGQKVNSAAFKICKGAKSSWANYRPLHHHHSVSNGRQRLCPFQHTHTHTLPVLQSAHTPTHILLCNIISGLSSCWEQLNPSRGKYCVGRITYTPAISLLIITFFFSTGEFKASVLMFSYIQSLAFTLDKIFIWLIT